MTLQVGYNKTARPSNLQRADGLLQVGGTHVPVYPYAADVPDRRRRARCARCDLALAAAAASRGKQRAEARVGKEKKKK